MYLRTFVFALTCLAVTGCQDDITTEKATWEAAKKDWSARLANIKKGHADLAVKVKAFAVPEGEAVLAAEKSAVDLSVETGTKSIAAVEKEVEAATTTIEGLIAKGKKLTLEVALGPAKSTVDGALAKAESLVNSANEALDMLSKKADAAQARAQAAKARADEWAAEMKKKGGQLAVPDVSFTEAAVDAEKSKVALSGLVAALKSCAELKVELTVTALGEVADLGSKRAEAVRAYLAANGVSASVVAKAVGSVVKEGEEKVAVAVTTPCK
jgi:hypothetical protein